MAVMEFQGFRNGACIASGDNSALYEYPNKYIYEGFTNCSGPPVRTVSLPPLGACGPTSGPSGFVGIEFPYSYIALNSTVTAV